MASKEKVSQKVQEAIFAQLLNNPINGQCADCHTASPNWVSLDFGVFICMRCSGVHRQLGPHISRVRSLKLDGWTKENIEIMATVGNKIANDYYEYKFPTGRRPGANASSDECRRFIDDKYINKKWIPQGFPEPVKDFVACREKGTKPDFSYSQQKQNKQQPVPQPVVQPEQPQPHHGLKFTRKKSASLDKVDHHHDKKPAQPTHHPDLLTQDIDLLGSYSEPSDDNQGIHSASPPPKKINFAQFKKAQSQPATHPLHHHQSVPDLTTTFPWAAQGGQQQQQQQQQGGNTAQAQPQENKVDVMKLYSQPQGHQNHFMQGMQGMNPGWQQYGNFGGMNQGYNTGYNMGHQNQFQGGYPQNYGAQQGFQGGQNMGNTNMGYNPYMNYGNQQGHAQNQFGNNNGFVQAQGQNSLF